jgi:putative inorganic carbon (hco3(-)) transporter
MLLRSETSNTWFSTVIVALLAIGLGGVIGFSLFKFPPVYVVGGLFGLIGVVIALINVELGLLALLAITFTRFSDVLVKFYSAPSIAKPFIVLMLVGVVLRWLFYRRPPRGWLKAALLVGMYGALVFLSLFYAADYQRSYDALDDFWKDGVIAIVIVILVQRKEMFRWAFWALMAAGAFMGSLSVYQYLTGTYSNNYWGFSQAMVMNIVGTSNDYRISGPYGSPNVYAMTMAALVPLALERVLSERIQILRLLALWALAAIGLTVVFTFSRSGFLSLSLALILFMLWRRTQIGTWVILAALALGLISILPEQYTARLGTLTDLVSSDSGVTSDYSFRGRASEATIGWLMFLDHPVLGVGSKNYPAFYQQYSRQLGLDQRTEDRSPHSLYVEMAAEHGLLGIIIFGVLIFSLFNGLIQAGKTFKSLGQTEMVGMSTAMTICLTAYLTSSIFVHSSYPRPFWVLVGLALSFPIFAQSLSAPQLVRSENG